MHIFRYIFYIAYKRVLGVFKIIFADFLWQQVLCSNYYSVNLPQNCVFIKPAVRVVDRVPSKVMDGSQYATHKVAGGIGRLVSPVRPLEKMVNAGGGLMSNLLGSGSRLLGKSVDEPRRVMFLYDRPLEWLGGSQQFRESVYVVLGHVLNNVVLHADDMEDGKRTIALGRMPVLGRVAKKLKNAGADKQDVETIVRLLGRNGLADLPESLESTVGVILNVR